ARLALPVGTPAAELLERATLAVARDAEAEARRRAALAGPRATARLLAVLPAVGLLLGAALGAAPWEQLLGGGAGTASGLAGLLLLVIGRQWTAHQIRVAERAGHDPGERAGPASGRGRPATRTSRAGSGCRAGRPPRSRVERLAAARDRTARLAVGDGAGHLTVEDRAAAPGTPAPLGVRRPWRGEARAVGLVPPAGPAAPEVEDAVVLELVEGACQAGVGIPQALDAVGLAVGGTRGAGLRRAARTLRLGASWEAAWRGAGARALERALRPAWEDGVPPGGLLRRAAEAARRDRDARAAEAAARLGVRLVVPLGLCHLPAFVLVGLVPVLGSMATTTLGS
ncbi:MAG: type II secretion system F family protein, partial [Actinotalea sp.]|nr:type II secretion system F family protein [Actinotalea sp.]